VVVGAVGVDGVLVGPDRTGERIHHTRWTGVGVDGRVAERVVVDLDVVRAAVAGGGGDLVEVVVVMATPRSGPAAAANSALLSAASTSPTTAADPANPVCTMAAATRPSRTLTPLEAAIHGSLSAADPAHHGHRRKAHHRLGRTPKDSVASQNGQDCCEQESQSHGSAHSERNISHASFNSWINAGAS